ncbi:MAG: tRNA pseudouridine(55) synthase TruB, partial [Bradyrhizobium sp.]|nr:tRNA pseudouridine(55) synthase TruB [Bradyrhizobium sp.]
MIVTTANSVIEPEIVDSEAADENNSPESNRDGNLPRSGKQLRPNNQPRRDKRDVHGWVVLDKPIGMTSTHAVAVVRRLFTARRGGHAGTLDPLATGCLPIALGEATKTVPFVMDGRKEYRFTLRFGEARSTEDAE